MPDAFTPVRRGAARPPLRGGSFRRPGFVGHYAPERGAAAVRALARTAMRKALAADTPRAPGRGPEAAPGYHPGRLERPLITRADRLALHEAA